MKNWKQDFWVIIAVFGIVVFVTCDNGDNTSHTHSFGTDWVKDETQHWYVCSCGEKSTVGNHTFNENGICTICGFEKPILRTENITLLFGTKTYGAIIEATLTRNEMDNVKNKLTESINKAYTDNVDTPKEDYLIGVFNLASGEKVTISIDNLVDYEHYKIVNRLDLHFDIDYLNKVSNNNLQDIILEIVAIMDAMGMP